MDYKVIEDDGIECLSPKEVMQILKLSKSEVYRIFNSKNFPSFKLGERCLRITKIDFKNWLDKQRGE